MPRGKLPNTMNQVIDLLLDSLEYPENGCWICPLCPSWRYPRIRCNYESHSVHHLAYELFVGPIPEGYDIHHTCEHTRCCNPDHLQAMSKREHYRLHKVKTHCPRGHEFLPGSFFIQANGTRRCRECMRRTWRDYYYRRKAKKRGE